MKEPRRILIFRPGSLGDIVVSLPCFHLLERRFPQAERRVLTIRPTKATLVAARSLLGESGLVHGFFEVDFKRVRSSLLEQRALRRRIRAWKPDLLVYLTDPRRFSRLAVEWCFFRLCGVRQIAGMGFRRTLREYRWRPERNRYEYETERLGRCIAGLGDLALEDRGNWSLRLRPGERARAQSLLEPVLGGGRIIACSIGTARDTNHWGHANWLELFKRAAARVTGCGLALVGAQADFDRSEEIGGVWRGPSVNLCGKLTARESAAVMDCASVFLGHDSGPMHLAASVGIPCVAVFSARAKPGSWFPYGPRHRVLYHDVPCGDCNLDTCEEHAKRCILSISVDEVLAALEETLPGSAPAARAGGLMR